MNMTKEKHGKCLRTQIRGDMVDYKSISNLRLFSWPLNKCAAKEKQRKHKSAGTCVGRCAGLGPPSNQQAGEAQYPPVE